MTEIDIAKLRELHEAATPPPWKADTQVRGDCVLWGPNGQFLANAQAEPHWLPAADGGTRQVLFDVDRRDLELVEAMRNALPALLDAARERDALRAEVDRLREHSTWLNAVGYRIATALGDGAASVVVEASEEGMVALADRLIRERDAYRKAKAENDERFQLAAAQARGERDALRSDLAHARLELKVAVIAAKQASDLAERVVAERDALRAKLGLVSQERDEAWEIARHMQFAAAKLIPDPAAVIDRAGQPAPTDPSGVTP